MNDTDRTDVVWPADQASVAGCAPQAVAALAIMAGADNAPWATTKRPKPEDKAFWDRVSKERDRIAHWAIQGLAISRRAEARAANREGEDA